MQKVQAHMAAEQKKELQKRTFEEAKAREENRKKQILN
jgi:hypothetical protein